MSYHLDRPASDFDSGAGLIRLEHFQMAYVTNDMERANALFLERLGIREFTRLEGENAQGGYMRADFAWVGSIMYELIAPEGPGSEIFSSHLSGDAAFEIRHHHLGYLVHNRAQWDAVHAHARQQDLELLGHTKNPLVEACFVRVPELGHYLEYLFPTDAGMEFFRSVSRN